MRNTKLFPETGLEQSVIEGMRIMLLTGMFGQIFGSITTGSALTGYVKALGAGDLLYSIFIAIPNITVVIQLVAAVVLERTGKRRGMLIVCGSIARFLWIPIGFMPFIITMDQALLRIWTAFLLYIVIACCNGFVSVSYNSFVTDFIPIRIRGNFLSTRVRLSMIAGVVAGFGIAFLLDKFPGFTGYCIVFCIASAAGLTDMVLTSRVQMPEIQHDAKPTNVFVMFREVLANKPFMRTVWTFTLWQFIAGISGPFFSVFMLNDLGMSFTQIMLMSTIVNNLSWALNIRPWGRLMDEYGPRAVLRILMLLAALTPLLWAQVHVGALWIIVITEIVGGMSWGPFEIGAQLTYFRQAPTKNRSMYIAMYAIITLLLGSALGNFTGGVLVETVFERLGALNWAPFGFAYGKYQYLFMLVAVGRIFVAIFLVPRLEESEEHRDNQPKHVLGAIRDNILRKQHFIKAQILRRHVRAKQRRKRAKGK